MQASFLMLVLGALLGVVLSLGSCAGVDTSQIEELANQYGIEAIDLDEAAMQLLDDGAIAEAADEAAEPAEPAGEKKLVGPGAEAYVQQLVEQNGLGEYVSFEEVVEADGTSYLMITTIGEDGAEYMSVLDISGNVVIDGTELPSVN